MAQIISSMNIFALSFCAFLYLKGKYFPSSTDCGSTGNVIFDFYWGTELYPRIFGWDVKQFTNCRCGMMFWPLFILSCAFKQYEMHGTVADSMIVNVALQLIYITKFFAWETGYLSSMDIMHDRAGFYICWGVLVFLPCVYTSHSMYLVDNPNELGIILSSLIFAVGLLAIYINYDCDRQRQYFRADHGRHKIWGKDPVFIEAKYKTESGEVKTSLLLASGYWRISRHFHYLPEILAAAAWTIPVWCKEYLPYFYIPYLILLLTDRAFRDDARCKCKYGKYWDQYCNHVPYMIIPTLV
jgi:7-dehydrocholesterol reductase